MKVLKLFKKYIPCIILIIIFLFVQAMGELRLPQYMSQIVDIGISKKGIENSIPLVLTEENFNKISTYNKNNNLLKNNYTFISKNNNVKIQNLKFIANQNLYILNSNTNDTNLNKFFIETLSKIYGEQYNINLSNLSNNEISNLSTNFILKEYETIGLDILHIQNNFIFNVGYKMIITTLLVISFAISVSFLASKISNKIAKTLRIDIFKKVMSFSNSELDKFSTASLITRSTNDISQIQNFTFISLRMLFFAPIMGIGALIKILNSNSNLIWIMILAILCLFIIIISLFRLVIPKFKVIQKLQDKLNLVSRESLTGILVIRAFSKENSEKERFDKINSEITKTNIFVYKIMGFMMPCLNIILNFSTILIIWFGAKQVEIKNMQVGDVMAFIQYSTNVIMSFLNISMISTNLPRAIISAKRVDEILSTESSIKAQKNNEPFKSSNGSIEFNNVYFKYPNAKDYSLKNISFKIDSGKTTAFIGSTGSGKTSILNLLLRFYDPTKGSIKVDDTDIKNVNLKELRNRIGYVSQKSLLFSGSIEYNLKFSNPNLSDKELIEACDIAQANNFILEKEDKFKSNISQGGSNISGGQKQRLSIARALVKKCNIFIFDDSFSALDYKTDKSLRAKLKEKMKDKTFLIVSQRISTIKDASKIIVLDKNEIVGIGTHDELLKSCYTYKQIVDSQSF